MARPIKPLRGGTKTENAITLRDEALLIIAMHERFRQNHPAAVVTSGDQSHFIVDPHMATPAEAGFLAQALHRLEQAGHADKESYVYEDGRAYKKNQPASGTALMVFHKGAIVKQALSVNAIDHLLSYTPAIKAGQFAQAAQQIGFSPVYLRNSNFDASGRHADDITLNHTALAKFREEKNKEELFEKFGSRTATAKAGYTAA